MSSNVTLVQSLYADFGSGNLAGVLARLTDDIRWREFDNPLIPFAGTRRGKPAVEQFFQAIATTVNVTAFNPADFIADGDRVVVLGHWAGTVKVTGKSFNTRWAMVWTIRNGLVSEFDCYEDHAPMTAAFKG